MRIVVELIVNATNVNLLMFFKVDIDEIFGKSTNQNYSYMKVMGSYHLVVTVHLFFSVLKKINNKNFLSLMVRFLGNVSFAFFFFFL